MALSLHDHDRRITEIELALDALRQVLAAPGSDWDAALAEATRKLRAQGAGGAADLLQGAGAAAPHRRHAVRGA